MSTTKEFILKLNGVETAIKNTKQLEEGIQALKDELGNADFGTPQFKALQDELRRANTEMEILEQSVEKFTPEVKFEAIANLAGGMGAAFGLASVAAANFGDKLGLSEEQVQEYEASLNSVLLAITSLTTLTQTFSGENLKNLKVLAQQVSALKVNAFWQKQGAIQTTAQALASNLETAAQSKNVVVKYAAATAQRVLNAVMAANPIFLVVAAVAALGSAYLILASRSEKAAERQKKMNEETKKANQELDKFLGDVLANRRANDLEALKAKGADLKSVYELEKKLIEQNLKTQQDAIKKAKTFEESDAAFLEKRNLLAKLELLEINYQNAVRDLAFKTLATEQDFAQRRAKIAEANGVEMARISLSFARKNLALAKQYFDKNSDEYKNYALKVAESEKALSDEMLAMQIKRGQSEIAVLQTLLDRKKALVGDQRLGQKEQLDLLEDIRQEELTIIDKALAQQLKASKLTEEQIIQAKEEAKTRRIAVERDYFKQVGDLEKSEQERQKDRSKRRNDAIQGSREENARSLDQITADEKKSTDKRLEASRLAERLRIENLIVSRERDLANQNLTEEERKLILEKSQNDINDVIQKGAQERQAILGENQLPILDTVFGKGFTEAFGQLQDTLLYINDTISQANQARIDAQLNVIDEAIAKSEEKLDALKQSYEETMASIDELEKQLLTARNTERDQILEKLAQEREKNNAIAAEKAKEDARIKKAEQEKIRLEKQRQKEIERTNKLNQIATAIQNALAAVEAVRAVINAGSKGKVGFDNIALIIAATAAVAAAFVSIAAASKKVKMEKGGLLSGATHALGGIPVGDTGVEVEGGEFVTNRRATANNPDAVETINRFGDRIKFKAVPVKYAEGGLLPDFSRVNAAVADPTSLAILDQLTLLNQTNVAMANRDVVVKIKEVDDARDRVAAIKEYGLSPF